jgi:hypothetical protein
MRKQILIGLYAIAGVLTAAQFIRMDRPNPPVNPASCMWNDQRVDRKVSAVLRRACADCHSHETQWPWYSKVSPVNWLVARDVEKGRQKLNFSKWSGSSRNMVEEIVDAVDKGEMPPRQYVWMHPEAKITQAEKELLEAWADGKPAGVH